MKKLLPLLTVLFLLLTVTPIFAKSDSSNNENRTNSQCSEDGEFKNHGQFVSCVAKQNLGGNEVSEAAKSDIGKKDHDDDEDRDEDNEDDNNASPTPSVSPSPLVSPSPSVSPSPDVSPSPSVSPSPTPAQNAQEQITFLQSIVDRLNSIIDILKNLL